MPLADVDGKDGTVLPEQIVKEVPKLKVGVIFGFTVRTKFVVVAHCGASGINV
jgi:hypothetical protein